MEGYQMTATAEVETKTTDHLVAELGRELESAQYELYLQDCQIAELKESVEDLMAGGVATKTPVRVRLSYGPPTKDRGWNFETTVEPTEPDVTAIDWDAIKVALARSYAIGEAEAIRRDELEGRTRRYFS